MTPETIQGILDTVEKSCPAAESLWLKFGEVRLVMRTNSPALVERLTGYFTGFIGTPGQYDIAVSAYEGPELKLGLDYIIKEPDPGKTKIKEEHVDLADGRIVRKRLTGLVFLFGSGLNAAVGPCLENDNQVINFINNRLIQFELDRGALLLHAAAVSREGKGLALAGFAGMGKSTLALHLMGRGLDFVSNDRLLIKTEGQRRIIRGVPKLPRINPGTALNNPDLTAVIPEEEKWGFSALDESDIWDLEHKYDVRIDDCFGPGRFVLESEAVGLAILNWQRNGRPALAERVDLNRRRDLLDAVMKSPGLFYEPNERNVDLSPEAYLEGLKDLAVIEVRGGVDFDRAATACIEVMQNRAYGHGH
ncbi:MAG: HprK-related kinase B [Proteobacteria bacterium]|nr:HprK-related kinase B [Pseudomonadota bacterium]